MCFKKIIGLIEKIIGVKEISQKRVLIVQKYFKGVDFSFVNSAAPRKVTSSGKDHSTLITIPQTYSKRWQLWIYCQFLNNILRVTESWTTTFTKLETSLTLNHKIPLKRIINSKIKSQIININPKPKNNIPKLNNF